MLQFEFKETSQTLRSFLRKWCVHERNNTPLLLFLVGVPKFFSCLFSKMEKTPELPEGFCPVFFPHQLDLTPTNFLPPLHGFLWSSGVRPVPRGLALPSHHNVPANATPEVWKALFADSTAPKPRDDGFLVRAGMCGGGGGRNI